MKKYFYSLIILLAGLRSYGQNVPNGDFENWINNLGWSRPVSWNTTDSIAYTQGGQRSVLQEQTIVYSGNSSMKMQSWTYGGAFTEPGAASTGILDFSTFSFEGGSPNTVRHDMLSGWYEYTPAGGDSCSVTVTLTKWNGSSRDVVGTGTWSQKNTISAYTQFNIPINYLLSENPDTALIVILAAPLGLGTAHAGTVMYVDDLSYSGVNGTVNLPENSFSINTYPNPASGFLTIESKGLITEKKSVSILDVTGKVLQSALLTGTKQQLDIRSLNNGNYLYELIDEKGTRFYSGKFSVNH